MEFNLNNFGKNLKLNKRGEKPEEISEDKLFVETINLLEACWNRSNKAYELFKVNLLEYEENYYQIIENLIFLKYGKWKTELILWYIFGRFDGEDNMYPLSISYKDTGEEEEVWLRTPSELWEFILKLEEHKNKNNDK